MSEIQSKTALTIWSPNNPHTPRFPPSTVGIHVKMRKVQVEWLAGSSDKGSSVRRRAVSGMGGWWAWASGTTLGPRLAKPCSCLRCQWEEGRWLPLKAQNGSWSVCLRCNCRLFLSFL